MNILEIIKEHKFYIMGCVSMGISVSCFLIEGHRLGQQTAAAWIGSNFPEEAKNIIIKFKEES